MNIDCENKGLHKLTDIFAAAGHKLYLVGGTVRNIALGLPEGDFDVCSAVHPHDAARILRDQGITVIEKALSLGTVEVRMTLDGESYVFEHTTFRRDYYPHGGTHRPYRVEFTDDMKADARRRDFTMNALYLDIQMGEIADPTGCGMHDIQNHIVRAAAQSPSETIGDDGLRIMRMARLAAELHFDISDDLLACAKQNAIYLKDISAERKYVELKKILLADVKYDLAEDTGIHAHGRGLQILRDIGALSYVLPYLCEGDGVAQSEVYHSHDVLGHGIYACAAAPPVFTVRLAALLHDIGKPQALSESGNMHGHEIFGEELARLELRGLKVDNATTRIVTKLVRHHMFDFKGEAKPKTIRKQAVKMGKHDFERLILLRRADFAGSGKTAGGNASADNWENELCRMIKLGVPWTVKDLHITGNEVAVLLGAPSPKVGEILDALFWECVTHPAMNENAILKRRADALAKNT